MTIQVNVFASLIHFLPDRRGRPPGNGWQAPDGSTVADLLAMLRLPVEEVRTVLVNGRKSSPDDVLRDGDMVHVFPMLCGG